jgi:hypothetical protein
MHRQNCNYLSTGEPTYWPSDHNKLPDLLDFFFYKVITTNYAQTESNHELSSDHTPVIATLSTHVINKPKIPTLIMNETNWDLFRTYIEDHINMNIKIKEANELDQATQYFTTIIQEAAWYSTPTPPNKTTNMYNIPLHIGELVAEKGRARNRWQNSLNNNDRINYNRLKRQLHNMLANIRNINFERYITSLSKDDHPIWKATKTFKRPQFSTPPIRRLDQSWTKSDVVKAENFAQHHSQVFTPHNSHHAHNNDEIENFLDAPCQMTLPIKAFSPREVRQATNKVDQHKAPGYDLITGKLLRQLPKKAILLLTTGAWIAQSV